MRGHLFFRGESGLSSALKILLAQQKLTRPWCKTERLKSFGRLTHSPCAPRYHDPKQYSLLLN
jgi:hypothetical protein